MESHSQMLALWTKGQSVKVGVLGKPKKGWPPQGSARGFGEFGPLCTEGRRARTSPEVRAVPCVWGSPQSPASAPAPCPTCGCPEPHEAGGRRRPLSKYDPHLPGVSLLRKEETGVRLASPRHMSCWSPLTSAMDWPRIVRF